MKILLIAAVSALTLMGGAAGAATTNLFVPGTADPVLAGAPAGASVTYSSPGYDTDYAAVGSNMNESPVSFAVTGGEKLTFSNVTDEGAGNCSGCTSVGPPISLAPFTASGFTPLVTNFTLPINGLVGLFNTTSPTLFSVSNGTIFAPTGATELYLGTVDGWQWNNNVGGYNLSITAGVPEPATWAMLALGLGAVGFSLRMNRRTAALAATAA